VILVAHVECRLADNASANAAQSHGHPLSKAEHAELSLESADSPEESLGW
jgi:hypothetical protein